LDSSDREKFNHLLLQVTARSPYLKNEGKPLSLTIDVHCYSPNLYTLLKFLAAQTIHTTFFLTGQFCQDNPEILPLIIQEGHEVGSHSYSHPDFTKLSQHQIIDELKKTEVIFFEQAKISAKPLFRAPYGALNAQVIRTIHACGYRIIGWTVDMHDSMEGVDLFELKKQILGCKAYDIILSHTVNMLAIEAIEACIPLLKKNGYQFLKISKLLDLSQGVA
jgi:peptidoglycan/xylan/chitin deacetylase (PgdA/CDA1 family)